LKLSDIIGLLEEGDDKTVKYGPMKRVLRRVDGKLAIVRKRKKALPQALRTISKAAARRRAKKSAINRKATQRRVTKKSLKTKKRARLIGLIKR
jgi:hypothetical protein